MMSSSTTCVPATSPSMWGRGTWTWASPAATCSSTRVPGPPSSCHSASGAAGSGSLLPPAPPTASKRWRGGASPPPIRGFSGAGLPSTASRRPWSSWTGLWSPRSGWVWPMWSRMWWTPAPRCNELGLRSSGTPSASRRRFSSAGRRLATCRAWRRCAPGLNRFWWRRTT